MNLKAISPVHYADGAATDRAICGASYYFSASAVPSTNHWPSVTCADCLRILEAWERE